MLGLTAGLFAAETTPPKFKVGLVLDKGGRDDKSFNASAFKGATEAKEKYDIHLKVVESSDDVSLEPALKTFAQRGYDLIIGIGFVQRSPVERVAKLFPKKHFVLVDAPVEAANVRSVLFNEHEGAFVVGAVGALASGSKKIGFIGGMDIPLIRRFEVGYQAGARYILGPKNEILANYVGTSSDAWRNPMKAKELALTQFNRKADVIFCAAGASCQGAFDAAEEQNKFVIGVDSNQNGVKPGRVLTSMVKRVDLAVLSAIEMARENRFQSGIYYLGLKESGVDYVIDEYNRKIFTPEIEKRAKEIKAKIIAGEINVPDVYKGGK